MFLKLLIASQVVEIAFEHMLLVKCLVNQKKKKVTTNYNMRLDRRSLIDGACSTPQARSAYHTYSYVFRLIRPIAARCRSVGWTRHKLFSFAAEI